uniref:5'-deoxynucleotidase HDDC2 n=1 Tax=Ornithorhynchus anatinus TaxID=9258 RepID=A0A6I8P5J7_ORNAN
MAGSGSGRSLLHFMRLLGQLKRVPRTGWVYRNVEKPESVSDHMYRMSIMALVTEDKNLNKDRCVRLALVHDMAECIVGDIAPADNVPKEEKHRREEEAMKQLTRLLSEDVRKEIFDLWEEYENQASAEARFVKELDQCEMILQAFEYEELENRPGRLQDFYDSTAGVVWGPGWRARHSRKLEKEDWVRPSSPPPREGACRPASSALFPKLSRRQSRAVGRRVSGHSVPQGQRRPNLAEECQATRKGCGPGARRTGFPSSSTAG